MKHIVMQEEVIMPGPGAYLFGDEERKELLDVMESGYLSRYGEENDPRFKHKVVDFEREFAKLVGVKHCVAVSSGTGALMTCLAALGIGRGDEVIVPGYTFIASISAILLMNATPVLAEIDESLTIDPNDIEKRITPRTKAIMPVHMLGNPCDMDKIMKIARKHKLFVIEDCCQAAGAKYRGKSVGSIGDIGGFSLNVFKTITAGDGGMVVTDNDERYELAFGFHDQGHKPLRMGLEVGKRSIVGMNFRVNELTGAVALAQVRKIPYILETLKEKKNKLKNLIAGTPNFTFRKINDEEGECHTLLTLLFDTKKKADTFGERIGTKTVAHSGWHVYNNMEQILKALNIKPHCLPQTDSILERAINVSVGVVDAGLGAPFGINILSTDKEIEAVAAKIKECAKDL